MCPRRASFLQKTVTSNEVEPPSIAHNQKSTVSQNEGSKNIKILLTSILDIKRITHYEFVPVRSGISVAANWFQQLNLW